MHFSGRNLRSKKSKISISRFKPSFSNLGLAILVLILLDSCGPSRRLQDGEYLLKKQKIINAPKDLNTEELNANLKQKTNKKLFGLIRFNLQMYNLPNPDKLEERSINKLERINAINEKRARKKKDKAKAKEYKPASHWLRNVVGEAPVLLDSTQNQQSLESLQKFLVAKGYFNSGVKDSIVFKRPLKKKRAKVYYIIDPGKPYLVRKKSFPMPERIAAIVDQIPKYPLLNEGDRFDVDLMDDEREMITKKLLNNGFHFFNKDFIYYQADSSLGNYSVDLIGGITGTFDSSNVSYDHLRTWKIDNITIEQLGNSTAVDSLKFEDYTFLNPDSMVIKPNSIVQHILFKKGDFYKEDQIERTYRRLLALPILNTVNISFSKSEKVGYLNCSIRLRKGKSQSFSVETKGTNSSGFLGLEGNLVYRNKNIFRGAETFTVKLIGGVQAQAALTDDGSEVANLQLNTVEFGPEISLQFPKFLLPIRQDRFARSANPSTNLLASFNLQTQPDFFRTISNLNFGISWSESLSKKHYINLIELSVINIDPTEEFQNYLDDLNNRLLTDAYRNHFITSTLYGFNYNSQKRGFRKNAFFYQGTIESSGSILRALHKLSGAAQDSLGSYELFNIRFAQFFKTDHDFRYYRYFSPKNSFALRVAGGIGVPLNNLDVLPFSESFFAGGSTGIRAWQARSLGPGSYFEANTTLDKIGDVHLEANFEYRFDLIGYLEGALFYDMGNIWLLNEDPLRPGSQFRGDSFLGEIAMGAGIGMRLDFDFFIIRLDVGSQLKDPSLVKGERWFFQPKETYNEAIEAYNAGLSEPANALDRYKQQYTFNLGINYPF